MKCVQVSKLWLRQQALPSSLAPEDVGKKNKKKNIHEQSNEPHLPEKKREKKKQVWMLCEAVLF